MTNVTPQILAQPDVEVTMHFLSLDGGETKFILIRADESDLEGPSAHIVFTERGFLVEVFPGVEASTIYSRFHSNTFHAIEDAVMVLAKVVSDK